LAELIAHLHESGLAVEPHFKGDDLGWTDGELRFAKGSPILVARWLTKEDDLRDDFNAYAAELETLDYAPQAQAMMERVIQTQQLITLRKPVDAPDETAVEAVLLKCGEWLATHGDGVRQVDGVGWLAADGSVLVEEH
jgi:hypothetical protein